VASPRRSTASSGLTSGQPALDGSSRGLITGALFKVARESTGLTQQDLADALDVDKTTVQAWETGRRPLTSARAGTLVSLRYELLGLGADPRLVDSLDTAAQADYLLDRLLDGEPTDSRHPLAVRVLPQPLADLLAWPLNPVPPRVVRSVQRPARRGPAAGGPALTADERRRLVVNLRSAAEDPPRGERGSLVRRQVAYLASFDRSPDTSRWLSHLRSTVRWAEHAGRFSPSWAEARSIAVAVSRQGDPDALLRFIAAGRDDDSWQTANLNYWAYWVGETRTIERDDSFMGAGLGHWRGLTLLDHLVARLGPDDDDLPLNVHTVWALLVARRDLLDDDPALARSLARRVAELLDAALSPAVHSEAEAIRCALRLARVPT
jgi:transcriptional regulator with XRE-family HTH domain